VKRVALVVSVSLPSAALKKQKQPSVDGMNRNWMVAGSGLTLRMLDPAEAVATAAVEVEDMEAEAEAMEEVTREEEEEVTREEAVTKEEADMVGVVTEHVVVPQFCMMSQASRSCPHCVKVTVSLHGLQYCS